MELYQNLLPGQKVLFPGNRKCGIVEGVRWDDEKQAWFTLDIDEDGEYKRDDEGRVIRVYSTTVIDKPERKKRNFTPSKENCTVRISPCGSTDKAYEIEDGWNGHWGRQSKCYYKYIAKSICYVDEEGRIFAPAWAVR